MNPILSLFPQISLLDLIDKIVPDLPQRPPAADRDPDQARTRRDFILDKLNDNPDAFASEEDVRAMMSHYPREF